MFSSINGSVMRDVMKHLIRSPQGAVGLFILVVAALMVCGGAHIAPYDPESISILARYKAPSAEHWFGTDQLGRDIFSRVMVGARATIVLSLLATLMSMVTGAVIGTASAYLGGKTDEAIMRTMDAVMSIPSR